MAENTSISKESERPAKRATRRKRPSVGTSPGSPEAERTHEQPGEESEVSPLDAVPSLAERVQAERERLFKAHSIVECCRLSTATKLEVGDPEYMTPALEVIGDLLNETASALELIGDDVEVPSTTHGNLHHG